VKNKEVKFRWITDVPDFKMPIIIKQGSKETRLEATNKWKSHSIKNNDPVKFDDYRFLIKITYN
ncbi:MAG: hypothetical protein DI548_16195, partial [Flavobacterium johnsoniae]